MSYNGRESGSINGREPPLGQYVEEADFLIFKENGVVKAKDGKNGSIVSSGSSIDRVINDITPGARAVFIHGGRYTVENTITNKPFYLFGWWNGVPLLELADGANCNMIEYNPASTRNKIVIEGLRLMGNRANNTSGSGIVLSNANPKELNIFRTEVRSFAGDGLKLGADSAISNWNMLDKFWTLDNDGCGVRVSGGGKELQVFNSLFGAKGHFIVEDGATLDKLFMVGNHFRPSNLYIHSGTQHYISGNLFTDGASLKMSPSSAHDYYMVVEGNTFHGGSGDTGIVFKNSNPDEVYITGNQFFTDTAVDRPSGANLNGVIQDNMGYVSRSAKGWVLIDTFEDADTGTSFSYDSGTISPTFNVYMVLLSIQGHGVGEANTVKVRVNNNSTGNYNFNYLQGGTVDYITGAYHWNDRLWDEKTYLLGYILRGGNHPSTAPANEEATIQSIAPASYDQRHILNGELDMDVGDITSVQVFNDFNATVRLKLFGLNLGVF